MKRSVGCASRWTLALCFLLGAAWRPGTVAAESIPFDSGRWEFFAKAHRVEEYLGRPALFLQNGLAVVKDSADFMNGVIEFDIAIPAKRGFSGAVWRLQDRLNYEEFYLRHHQSGNEDANQYSPVFNGLAAWQLHYSADGFGYPVKYDFDQWMPVKIVISGTEAEIYVKDMQTPIVYVPQQRLGSTAGKVGLRGQMFAPAHYANFRVTKMDQPPMKRAAKEVAYPPGFMQQMKRRAQALRGAAGAPAPGTVKEWQVSEPFPFADLDKQVVLPPAGTAHEGWTAMKTEESGLLNLARVENAAAALKEGRNAVFVKKVVTSKRNHFKKLEFGFSDRVKVYLNAILLFEGNDAYATRDYRFLGTVGYFDALYLPLKSGRNELVLAVGEQLGGWGVKARFADPDGISLD